MSWWFKKATEATIHEDLLFDPRPDITALELARLLGFKFKWITREGWEKLPPDLARHFKERPDD